MAPTHDDLPFGVNLSMLSVVRVFVQVKLDFRVTDVYNVIVVMYFRRDGWRKGATG